MARIQANLVKSDDTSVTYKPIEKTNKRLENFRKEGIKTMNDCFNYAVKQHGNKNLVGTRKILGKSEELQPNGKIFEKWEMGEYRWRTYIQIENMSENFGIGLRELGLHPMERICIFAETNADWMVCALSCFKQTFPLVTIYANLGDDAIVHVVNETEVTHLITSHELLPKFKSVLLRTPSIKHLIFLEDQIDFTDTSGYNDAVEIHAFHDVIALGQRSATEHEIRITA